MVLRFWATDSGWRLDIEVSEVKSMDVDIAVGTFDIADIVLRIPHLTTSSGVEVDAQL